MKFILGEGASASGPPRQAIAARKPVLATEAVAETIQEDAAARRVSDDAGDSWTQIRPPPLSQAILVACDHR